MSFRKQIDFFSYEWDSFSLYRKFILNNIIFKAFFFPFRVSNLDSYRNQDIISIKTMSRKDYDDFFNRVLSVLDCFNVKLSSSFRLNKFIYYNLRKLISLYQELDDFSLMKKIYIIFSIARYLQLYQLDSIFEKRVVVLSHAEMQPIENFIVENAKYNLCKTISLQHGLYVDYSSYKNINVVNYENISTSHFICWGENTKRLIKKFNPNVSLSVCGVPLLHDNEDLYSEIKFISVVFDQNLFCEQNKKILKIGLDIANNLGVNLNVRLHPRNNKNEYDFSSPNLLFELDCTKSLFVIGHTSSYLVELMSYGVKVCVYDSGAPSLAFPKEIVFNQNISLTLMSFLLDTPQLYFVDLAKDYIKCYGNESLQLYKSTIKSLVDDGN